jgi:hypothetical protein
MPEAVRNPEEAERLLLEALTRRLLKTQQAVKNCEL